MLQSLARLFGVALLVVGFSEILVALDSQHQDKALGAYLVKADREYLVVWRTSGESQYKVFRFQSVREAEHFLKTLRLSAGGPLVRASNRPQRLWLKTEGRNSVIFWKLSRFSFTHRLTFENPAEARYFFSAFERGFYSPSPFGHAILFSRTSF